jgi:hypothetical protein
MSSPLLPQKYRDRKAPSGSIQSHFLWPGGHQGHLPDDRTDTGFAVGRQVSKTLPSCHHVHAGPNGSLQATWGHMVIMAPCRTLLHAEHMGAHDADLYFPAKHMGPHGQYSLYLVVVPAIPMGPHGHFAYILVLQ